MGNLADRIIVVIEDGKKSIRFDKHADEHIKDLPVQNDKSKLLSFVEEVKRKLMK